MDDIRRKTQFEDLYDSQSDAVFRRCFFKTSDREVAKDITQESFVRLWKYYESGEEIDNAKALLFRIANNLIIDYYRKKSAQSLDSMQEQGFDPVLDDHERISNNAEIEFAMEIINELPDMYREVVVMRFVEEMQPQEIAEITGQSENVISVRIHRGMKKVKEIIEEKEELGSDKIDTENE